MIPAILLALTIHEFSHALVAYKFGDRTAKFQGRLTLNPIKHLDPLGALLLLIAGFGWAKPVPVNPYNFKGDKRKGMMWVSLAGPGSNFISAIVAAILMKLLAVFAAMNVLPAFILMIIYQFLFVFLSINVVLAVFNLLPVPPLDGSKILAGIIPARYGYIIYNLERYGSVILLLLVVLGVINVIIGPPIIFIQNLITSLVGIY